MASSADSDLALKRAATAAQACQTCHNRKTKCDEQRPKCGLCTRLEVECFYRKPVPTKKDKTLVHILDTLSRLEIKFDGLDLSSAESDTTSPSGHRSSPADTDHPHKIPKKLQQTYQHLTVPHKIVLWPSIYVHLINSGIKATSDLQYVLREGTPCFIRLEMTKHPHPLRADVGLPHFAINAAAEEHGYPSNVAFPTLSIQQSLELTDAYFNTFHILFPLLNKDTFMNEILAPLLRDGYGHSDANAVIALLVFALGQVAIEGVSEQPISFIDGQASGFRGGSVDKPPGLAIFNEARWRLGFVVSQTTLESVQIQLLEATYYEAHARHLEFWRCAVSASMACQALIRCNQTDWHSPTGDLLMRAYWTCMLSEDFYHLDLDLPHTDIASLQDEVPLPYFHEVREQQNSSGRLSENKSHFQHHFLAMIALHRLIARIIKALHESTVQSEQSDDYGGPPVRMIKELARQLDSWRSILPPALQWSDDDKFNNPSPDSPVRRSSAPLFSYHHGSVPGGHKHNLDVVTAQLRTRFYYARFIVYRPFVYKALHFPELMKEDDAHCCALAIKSACLWPMSMSPPKDKKRLVPHLFAWTQNFMGILLILRMTTENESLRQICESHVNHEDIRRTTELMLDWVRDVKQLDGIAEWSWRILEPLYSKQAV